MVKNRFSESLKKLNKDVKKEVGLNFQTFIKYENRIFFYSGHFGSTLGMKAVIQNQYGPPEFLEIGEIQKPEPKANEVLIKVMATTVNRTDCGILLARPFISRFYIGLFKPSSPIPGTDFAGQIEAIGSEVTKFSVGDRVWGFNDTGLKSQAQYMVLNECEAIFDIPEGFSYEQAASSAEGAHYANNFINKINIQKGEKVLVNGATGSIGSASVQLLKHLEVQVTAVSHSDNYDLVKSLGADKVINFDQQDFTKKEGGYHYIFDAVGKSTFAKCRPLLLPGGIYTSSELGPHAQNLYFALSTPITGKLFGWQEGKKVIFPIPFDIKASLSLMKRLMEQGKFKPLIDRKYPMEAIREAYSYVLSGQKVGNVVITYQ